MVRIIIVNVYNLFSYLRIFFFTGKIILTEGKKDENHPQKRFPIRGGEAGHSIHGIWEQKVCLTAKNLAWQ